MNSTIKFQKNNILLALLSSVASIGLHLYLALNHYKIKFGIAEGKSLCNISDKFNCDVVAVSKYASFLKVPMATWGAVTHLALSTLLLLWLIGLVQNSNRLLRLSFLLGSFIALTSVAMGLISGLLLNTFCPFCLVTYVLSFFILLFLFLATRSEQNLNFIFPNLGEDLASLFSDFNWVSILLIVLIPGLGFLSDSIFLDALGLKQVSKLVPESIESWKGNTQKTFNLQNGIVFGPVSSEKPLKMILVEFGDFLCPHCKMASAPLHQFVTNKEGTQLIFKLFPLDGICNDQIPRKGDGLRCQLAYAVTCANTRFQSGWKAYDYIFEHQASWNIATFQNDLKKMLEELNINESEMKACMENPDTHNAVISQAKEASGIQGTPTVFANGQELPGGHYGPVLEAAAGELGF